jgi:hypothetical protein
MKRASKKKGEGWDVFEASGSSGNTARLREYYEIQRYDAPETPEGDPLRPAFRGDREAVRYVVEQAKRGDEVAIAALWRCDQDDFVHLALWGQL